MTSYKPPLIIPLTSQFNASDFPDENDNYYAEMAQPNTNNGIVSYKSDGLLHSSINLTVDDDKNLQIYKDNSIILNNGMTDDQLSSIDVIPSSLHIKRGHTGVSADAKIEWNELYSVFQGGITGNEKPFSQMINLGNNNYTIPFVSNGGSLLTTNNNFVFNNSNSNLGIGTSTPSAKVHIVQTGSDSSFRVDDILNDTTPFIINDSGNLGINTSTPLNKCTIFSDPVTSTTASSVFSSVSDATLYLRRITTDAPNINTYGGSLFFGDNVGTAHLGSGISGVQTANDDDQTGIAFFTHIGSGTGSVVVESMRLTHDGVLCLNTNTPNVNSILDINSTSKVVKLSSLSTTNKNNITSSSALICYDSTINTLAYRDNNSWRNLLRPILTMFKVSTTQTSSLGISPNLYYKLNTGGFSPVGDSEFVSNGDNYTSFKFVSSNPSNKRAKFTINCSYSINGSSQKLNFSMIKGGSFTSGLLDSGVPFNISTTTSSPTSDEVYTVSSVCISDVLATDDLFHLIVSDSTSGSKTLTIYNLVILCETTL